VIRATAPALMLAGALALPQAAAACAQLSQHVWLCDRGTPWEMAEWDQYGDGSTLYLDDLRLNFTEEWPGHRIGENDATLEEQYVTYAEWMKAEDNAPEEVFATDRLDLPEARVLRYLQRDRIAGEPATMSAVMLAEVAAARIMLWLDAPETTPMAEIDTLSRDLAAMLRGTCADAVSCAEDYEPPAAEE
jgi:hypothetical protein